ncbi:hypothetical protein OsccyDRAFT_0735 [Leptolyngbyaceae cyanobacterium JSC-12]|nr:hypothetical protein OsccyDRAFT_0735 [Leptolyngbyaceae cyanobacterium JSC-12]
MARNKNKRHELTYPIELPWSSRIWTLKEGDVLEDESGQQFVIKKVHRSVVPGEIPTLDLEPHQ